MKFERPYDGAHAPHSFYPQLHKRKSIIIVFTPLLPFNPFRKKKNCVFRELCISARAEP
jgi:hypothetical protein